jgi:membrane protein DedA with SNARE-associated domain
MPDDLVFYISHYGYLAIFLFIFLQEIGAPTPLPNELILIFSGYLAFTGILKSLPLVLTVAGADLLAAATLYLIFHFFGTLLLNSKSRWIPISQQSIHKQSQKIARLGFKGIVIGRLSPFIRGYVAVICGLLHINPKRYGFTIMATSVVWSSFYIAMGYLLGPYWRYINTHLEEFKYMLMAIPAGIFLWIVTRYIIGIVCKKHAPNTL